MESTTKRQNETLVSPFVKKEATTSPLDTTSNSKKSPIDKLMETG